MEKVVLLLAPGEGLLLCLHCFSKQHPAIAQAMQAQTIAIVQELRATTKPAANAVDEWLAGMKKYSAHMKEMSGGNGSNWMDFLLGLGAIIGPRLDKVIDIAVTQEFGGAAPPNSAGQLGAGASAAKRPAVPAEVAAAVKQMLSSTEADDILAGYATVMAHLRSTPEGVARTDKMVELAKASNGKMLLIIGITDELQKMGFGEFASIPRVRRVVETLDATIKASLATRASEELKEAAPKALPITSSAETLQTATDALLQHPPQPLANIFQAAGLPTPASAQPMPVPEATS